MIPKDTDFDTEVTLETASQPLPDDPPFRILMLGDWSGREGKPLSEVLRSRPIEIDRDNFDEVLAKLSVQVELDLNSGDEKPLLLQFNELDDFHPDNIFKQVPMFAELREIRRRLRDENHFESAAAEVRAWFSEEEKNSQAQETQSEPVADQVDSGGLLDNILDQSSGAAAERSRTAPTSALGKFVNKIVGSHIVRTDENEQARLVSLVDQATGDLMRTILHHPRFQELEAAWRGVYLLVRRVETDVDLKIYLLDLTKQELTGNLKSVNSLAESDYFGWVVRESVETPGGEPWAFVCGNYSFAVNVDDAAALLRIAKISEAANAPFISHLQPDLFGIANFEETPEFSKWKDAGNSDEGRLWETIRSLPESRFLGLAMPRYLARLPYGAKTDPTEAFDFEEFVEISEHRNYLWANPSFVCALLLGQTYRRYGWEMSKGFQLSISDLPTHIYSEDGETKTKPCAEILMTEPICQKLLDEGIIPLISFKNTDRVQLGRFQSVALPPTALGARWS